MKYESALYHLLLDRARSLRTKDSTEPDKFIDALTQSLIVEHKQNIFNITWEYNNRGYGPVQIPRSVFDFYVRADTPHAAGRLDKTVNYRVRNWTQALKLLRSLAMQSGVNSPWLASDMEIETSPSPVTVADVARLKLIMFLSMAVLTGIFGAMARDIQEGVWIGLIVLGLLILAERTPDAHLHQVISHGERAIIILGALVLLVWGRPSSLMVVQLLPLVILSYAERSRARAPFWALPGLSLTFLGLYPLTQTVGYLASFLLAAIVWAMLAGRRLPFNAGNFLIAGVIAGCLASLALQLAAMAPALGNTEMPVPPWFSVATFVFFMVGTLLLWIHGMQFSLIPWTVCLCLGVGMLPGLFTEKVTTVALGGIGLGFVIVQKIAQALWRSREKPIIG